MARSTTDSAYSQLFAAQRRAGVSELWTWQAEVLGRYEHRTDADAAIELPTGSGKTLVALLAADEYRVRTERPVAYLTGTKQLAQQVEREAVELGFPIGRFQGPKTAWSQADRRAYHWGQKTAVMNYWAYFNAAPGVDPAGLLILDDVHLAEGPLRDFFTVRIGRGDALFAEIVARVSARFPHYTVAADLAAGVDAPRPPEMLAFPDSAEISGEIRDLLDARLVDGTPAWWGWQRVRDKIEACCWLVSPRAFTITPFIPPTQEIPHFADADARLYLSATVGTVDDLQRRLGCPPLQKITADAHPRQGERLVLFEDEPTRRGPLEVVERVSPLLDAHPKGLWLCARRDTAMALEPALVLQTQVPVWRLVEDNGADEPFANATSGHLVTAGRYDGMDFPDDACRVEVLPEVPVATSDLEEFTSAYLRDAQFAEARFAQRVAQALGRCNRSEQDRAVYVLADPEFLTRLSRPRVLAAMPEDVRDDLAGGIERSDRGFAAGLDEALRFLGGAAPTPGTAPPAMAAAATPPTATKEVAAFHALWREDYRRAAEVFDEVAAAVNDTREYRAFWLAMRALALQLAGELLGDRAAERMAQTALQSAANVGATNTFFTRLRAAIARQQGTTVERTVAAYDDLFTAWDRLIDRWGPTGPRFERFTHGLVEDLKSDDHDTVAHAIADVGRYLLGFAVEAPQATRGEHDAGWRLRRPARTLSFEVKLAPVAKRIVNDDVEQAEGAVRALERERPSEEVRGLIVVPYRAADDSALDRLDRVQLIERDVLVGEAERLLLLLHEYRSGWSDEAAARAARRDAVERRLPPLDWLWLAAQRSNAWVESEELAQAFDAEVSAA
jgi:hypothetical protein